MQEREIPLSDLSPSPIPASDQSFHYSAKPRRKWFVPLVIVGILLSVLALAIGLVFYLVEPSKSSGSSAAVVGSPPIAPATAVKVPPPFLPPFVPPSPASTPSSAPRPLPPVPLPSRVPPTTVSSTTQSTLPRRTLVPVCVPETQFLQAFKHKCSLRLSSALPSSPAQRCSLLSEVLLCTQRELLPSKCSIDEIVLQFQRITPEGSLSRELGRLKLLTAQCPANSTRPPVTGLVALPTTAPLCLIEDSVIIDAFYQPQCIAMLYREAESDAAKCRNLYALLDCMHNEFAKKNPECTYKEAYYLMAHPDNERYFTRVFNFKPSQCPLPTEQLPPQPTAACDLKRDELKLEFRSSCLKLLESGSSLLSFFCRRYDTTVRCLSQHIKSQNKTCSEQYIRQVLAEKDTANVILRATGHSFRDCGGPTAPTCTASDGQVYDVLKAKCLLVLTKLNTTGASTDKVPSDLQCNALQEVYACVSFTLLRKGQQCSTEAVRWHLELPFRSRLFKDTFGFTPLQCDSDYVPAPTPVPRCAATDQDILDALSEGCLPLLWHHDGSLLSKCTQYKLFVECTVSRLASRNHSLCREDPVRYLLEHDNNRNFFQRNFGYHPEDNCTFVWPTDPTPTDGFLNNNNEDYFSLPDPSVVPCASPEVTVLHLLDSCTLPLVQQEAQQDQSQARLCWAWFRAAECLLENLLRSRFTCEIERVHAAMLQNGVESTFSVGFGLDARICFNTRSTAAGILNQG